MYDLSLKGYTTATDLADWMVKNLKISFREAHEKAGKLVLIAESSNKQLHNLDIEVFNCEFVITHMTTGMNRSSLS